MERAYWKVLTTFAAGAAGGGLFAMLGLPLPWILGAAFAVMVLNTVRPGLAAWPRLMGDAGVAVVAYVLGSAMTFETVRTIAQGLPAMLLAAALWTAVCTAIGLLFAKATGLSVQDGVLGSMPGGLTQMVLLADQMRGADAGIVAIMQTSRLIVVLYMVPFLAALFAGGPAALGGAAGAAAGGGIGIGADDGTAGIAADGVAAAASAADGVWTGLPPWAGYAALPLVPLAAWLARRIHLPAGEFLGPVLAVGALAAAGFPWPSMPAVLLAAAQLAIGIYIGQRVQPRILLTNRRFGPLSLLSACLLVALTALAAWGLSAAAGGSVATWFLALAPGGLGEMAVTALVLDADESRVTAYQLCRLLFVLLAAPPLLKLAFDRGNRKTARAVSERR
ncbi:membrane protein AbrB duplication [Thermobacillus composti KWC4]|uniref:Membrane protein AbrB duplication n=1 Tax=Thermobacillus composti (strain DSM 18247 / JCM 13945 / KWC4) TaxID=717605 RepID=L0EGG1_THECK|nr:membrane protein AbrB duplication [Thermobacillus composti KWC4]